MISWIFFLLFPVSTLVATISRFLPWWLVCIGAISCLIALLKVTRVTNG